MRIIGFAGTAKNTGKTTAALTLLELARTAGLTPALTSIGFDGESLDHVTGLPKPRYILQPGDLLATAETCLAHSSARCEVLQETGIHTILGRILIARVTDSGSVQLAGPNRSRDLQEVYRHFAALGADWTLADGALNRLVPLVSTDGLVLSTGAAFDEHIPNLAAHAAGLHNLFALPELQDGGEMVETITVTNNDQSSQKLAVGSLLSVQTQTQLMDSVKSGTLRVEIPGACSPELLDALLPRLEERELVFSDPLRLAASANPLRWQALIQLAGQHSVKLACRKTLPVLFLTVNPFYPLYRQKNGQYEAEFVDKLELLKSMQTALPGWPVVDIQQPPLPDLLALAGLKSLKGQP